MNFCFFDQKFTGSGGARIRANFANLCKFAICENALFAKLPHALPSKYIVAWNNVKRCLLADQLL